MITTSIGSWPGKSIEKAVDWAFSLSVPALPELPELDESESLLGQAEGKPAAALPTFLKRLQAQPPKEKWVKFQRAGPITLQRGAGLSRNEALACVRKNLAPLLAAELPAGSQRLVLLDEPMLSERAQDMEATQTFLRELTANHSGVTFGIHCCGKKEVALALLARSWSALSIDLNVLGKAAQSPKVRIPLMEKSRARQLSLIAFTGASPAAPSPYTWHTPGCGLAGKTTAEVEETLAKLRD
jgi:hypothetical protein